MMLTTSAISLGSSIIIVGQVKVFILIDITNIRAFKGVFEKKKYR